MGENPFYHYHAGSQLQNLPRLFPNHDSHQNKLNHTAHADTEEEEYTIKCICGFSDDDGHTTLCEQCNTWQHVECFYWPDLKVPEVHQCTDCLPRPTHPDAAAARQRQKREANNGLEERKARRTAQKNHRKSKPKDQVAAAHPEINGWATHEDRQDHTGPDYIPPLKRSKTYHRHSHSTAEMHPDYQHQHSEYQDHAPSRSPFKHPKQDPEPQYISPEYARAYRDHEHYQLAENKEHNGYSNINVVSILSNWLMNPHNDSLRPFHKSTIDFEPPVSKIVHRDGHPSAGTFDTVRLVVNKAIAEGGLVGQVIGDIGLREEYMANPKNQWDRLRHPDHFVFFHPQLDKIFIDCRDRGSLMRFARRGCDFNVKVETILTGDRNLGNAHFYLTATRDIKEGEEIVLGWKPLDKYLIECITLINAKGDVSRNESEYVAAWVNNLLTHFGGCACDGKADAQCNMRAYANVPSQAVHSKESSKSHSQRQRSQRSPLKLLPEAKARNDSEGELTRHKPNGIKDRRGSTRSSRSLDSRDATPNSHSEFEARNGFDSEPSEREKKKIAQQMRLLEKADQENSRIQAKKKRRSGSHPHTPTTIPAPVSSHHYSKNDRAPSLICDQMHYVPARDPAPSPNASTPPSRVRSPNIQPSAQGSSRSSPRGAASSSTSTPTGDESRGANGQSSKTSRVKPLYVDAAVQTVPIVDPEARPSTSPHQRKPFVSLSQRLLRRNHQRRQELKQQERPVDSLSTAEKSPRLPPMESIGAEPYAADSVIMPLSDSIASPIVDTVTLPTDTVAPAPSPSLLPVTLEPQPSAVNAMVAEEAAPNNEGDAAADSEAEGEYEPEPARVISPVVPASAQDSAQISDTARLRPIERTGPRSANMHVDLPPPTFSLSSSMNATGNYTMSPSSEISRSPSTSSNAPFAAPMAPMSAPTLASSTSSVTRPSPMKKKISLSEYTIRNQARTPGSERTQSQTFGPGHAEALAAIRRASAQSSDSDAIQQSPGPSQMRRELPRPP